MPVADPANASLTGASLLLMAGGDPEASRGLEGVAAGHGLDVAMLRIQASSPFLSLIGRGDARRMSGAADALRAGGLLCAAVPESEARGLPRLQIAGGVAPEGSGAVLRVHGKPAGPPQGVPLLFVFGDLGREEGLPEPSAPRPSDTLRQRILRAVFPVVDVVWNEGRIRVALRTMTWRGLPGFSPSAPTNFLHLLEVLAERSAGAVLDLGYRGQDLAVEPGPGSPETLEGCDAATAVLFDRYASAAAVAWRHGLYPASAPGRLVVPADTGGPRNPAEIFRARPSPAVKSPVPWIRRGRAARVRQTLWPWLSPGALVLFFFRGTPLGIAVLAASGLLAIGLGLRWLRARERVRALPLARVRSAAMGPVQLSGNVVPCAALVAPYARVRAGWYRLEIQERRGDSNRSHAWTTIQDGGSGDIPFRLDDGTGSILVQPSGAEVDVPPITTPVGPDLRAVEWVIGEGAPIFVLGFAQRRAAGDATAAAPSGTSASGSDADDVFVGSSPGAAFLISHRSREEEKGALSWKFRALVALGFTYMAGALVLWILRAGTGS